MAWQSQWRRPKQKTYGNVLVAVASQQSAKADGSKWPQCNKNRNSPKQGNKWWPELAKRNGSEWPQRKKKMYPGTRHQ
jgi:hypothetical protein